MATDHETEERARSHREHRRIQRLLQLGLALGAAALVAGLAIAIGGPILRGEPLRSGGTGSTVARAGIIALALTPVVRVAALVWLWIRERDWRFVAVGGIVLLVLVFAIASGHAA